MFNDISKPPPPLPQQDVRELEDGVTLLAPLSRRGSGPGVLLLVPDTDASTKIIEGIPSHLIKWAEEGYTVIQIQQRALFKDATNAVNSSIQALNEHSMCEPKDVIGVIAYEPSCWNLAASTINSSPSIKGTVLYANTTDSLWPSTPPALHHLAGTSTSPPLRTPSLTKFQYPSVLTSTFAIPFQPSFHYTAEALSHTRSITHLKKLMGGPYFDLEMIWEEHTYYEFADRSVEHTMSTMVQEPYVNHVPTLTGGVGRTSLTSFYRNNFIFNNSADTALELISRSIAIDRIIDEFIFTFTHDRELDWLLPGVPPTNLKVQVPFTAVVNIRGDRLYHEHISWDQGTVLRQLGLLPEYLPFPYKLPGGKVSTEGKVFEYRVPVAGTDAADKMRDRNLVESNLMFDYEIREV